MSGKPKMGWVLHIAKAFLVLLCWFEESLNPLEAKEEKSKEDLPELARRRRDYR